MRKDLCSEAKKKKLTETTTKPSNIYQLLGNKSVYQPEQERRENKSLSKWEVSPVEVLFLGLIPAFPWMPRTISAHLFTAGRAPTGAAEEADNGQISHVSSAAAPRSRGRFDFLQHAAFPLQLILPPSPRFSFLHGNCKYGLETCFRKTPGRAILEQLPNDWKKNQVAKRFWGLGKKRDLPAAQLSLPALHPWCKIPRPGAGPVLQAGGPMAAPPPPGFTPSTRPSCREALLVSAFPNCPKTAPGSLLEDTRERLQAGVRYRGCAGCGADPRSSWKGQVPSEGFKEQDKSHKLP